MLLHSLAEQLLEVDVRLVVVDRRLDTTPIADVHLGREVGHHICSLDRTQFREHDRRIISSSDVHEVR